MGKYLMVGAGLSGAVIGRQEGRLLGSALAIEGTLPAAFYSVRDEVYRQFRLVQEPKG